MSLSNEDLGRLSDQAASVLGVDRREAIEYGLRLIIAAGKEDVEGMSAVGILCAADKLSNSLGAFTMDDLIDDAFGDQPVFSPHKVKIFAAKILTASGFVRRQYRRGSSRPLLWLRDSEAV
tara:strand:+ start:263 stop:625 length:363 start_codon:yes stop_codon:yes gene_type:complete